MQHLEKSQLLQKQVEDKLVLVEAANNELQTTLIMESDEREQAVQRLATSQLREKQLGDRLSSSELVNTELQLALSTAAAELNEQARIAEEEIDLR